VHVRVTLSCLLCVFLLPCDPCPIYTPIIYHPLKSLNWLLDLDDPNEFACRWEENRVRTKADREAKKPQERLRKHRGDQATQPPCVGHEKVKPGLQQASLECRKRPQTWLQRYLAAHPEHHRVHVAMTSR
jgi:hypothetical protein